jgi:hypothetical protein
MFRSFNARRAGLWRDFHLFVSEGLRHSRSPGPWPCRRRNLDVAGFQITVNDAFLVRSFEASEIWRASFGLRQWYGAAAQSIRQRLAFDELEHPKRMPWSSSSP